MEWNELVVLGLIAFAMTMSLCGAIGELTKAQMKSAAALAEIHAELIRLRERGEQ